MPYDPFQILFWPMKFLKFVGIWLEKDAKIGRKIFGAFIQVAFIDLHFLLMFINLFLLDDINEVAAILTLVGTSLSLVIKSLSVTAKVREIEDLMKFVKDFMEKPIWAETQSCKKLQKEVSQVEFAFKIYVSTTAVSVFFYLLTPFLTHELSSPMYFPYDYKQNELYFWLTVTYQFFGGFIIPPSAILLDMVAIHFICVAVGLVEELNSCMENLNFDGTNEAKKMKEFVEIHLEIRNFILKFEKIFSLPILVQGLVSGIIICTSCYLMATVS